MIKIRTQLLLLVLPLIILFSCGKSEEKTKEQQSIDSKEFESIDSKGEKVFLSYNFEKGQKLSYKLTTIMSAQESIQADSSIESKIHQTITYQFDLNVIDIDEDKVSEFSVNINNIKLDANMNGEPIKFDTKNQPSEEDKNRFLDYITIANSPYRARVSNRGEVLEVSRIDKMIDKMNSMSPQPQKLTADQKIQLSKNLSEAALRPLTQLLFREFPDSQVGKDSTWNKKYKSKMTVFDIENTVVFKVDDFIDIDGDKGTKISANLSAKWTGVNKGEEEGVKYNFADPKISGNGKIIFNVDKGILVSAQTLTNVEMSVEVDAKDSMLKSKISRRREISSNKNIVELLQ